MVAENLQCSERAEEIKKYFESVSGFGRFRWYTSGEKLSERRLETKRAQGNRRPVPRRDDRPVRKNEVPDGLKENPPAYLIGAIVNEAKNVHRTRERRRIDENIDLPELSVPARGSIDQALLDALEEAKTA